MVTRCACIQILPGDALQFRAGELPLPVFPSVEGFGGPPAQTVARLWRHANSN